MAKFRIENSDPEWSVEYKNGDGFEKVWDVTTKYVSHTYDEILFDKYNLILYALYIAIAIVGASLVVYTIKCICLCISVRKIQNDILQQKLSSNKKKLE